MSYLAEENKTEITTPKLLIPLESYQKIMAYADVCDIEISGFADITYSEKKAAFVVGEVYLFKQENSGGDTELDEEAIADFMLDRMDSGETHMPRLWWHSHVNMAAFFSGTDTGTMAKTLENDSWMVALVVNKRHEMRAMARSWQPFKFTIDNLPIQIEFAEEEVPQAIIDEVEEKVTEKKFEITYPKKGKGYNQQGNSMWFPKNREEAIERVRSRKLFRTTYNQTTDSWTWRDPANGDQWIDYHKVLSDYIYGEENDLKNMSDAEIEATILEEEEAMRQ